MTFYSHFKKKPSFSIDIQFIFLGMIELSRFFFTLRSFKSMAQKNEMNNTM